jgi:hypothetical protein
MAIAVMLAEVNTPEMSVSLTRVYRAPSQKTVIFILAAVRTLNRSFFD